MRAAFEQALQIKSAALARQRCRFDASPDYYQRTLWTGDEAEGLRALPLEERLARAAKLKEEGTALLRVGDHSAAVERYALALGAFCYLRCTDPAWRRHGLRDDAIEEVDERPAGGEPRPHPSVHRFFRLSDYPLHRTPLPLLRLLCRLAATREGRLPPPRQLQESLALLPRHGGRCAQR